jgi:hypothetical protein
VTLIVSSALLLAFYVTVAIEVCTSISDAGYAVMTLLTLPYTGAVGMGLVGYACMANVLVEMLREAASIFDSRSWSDRTHFLLVGLVWVVLVIVGWALVWW